MAGPRELEKFDIENVGCELEPEATKPPFAHMSSRFIFSTSTSSRFTLKCFCKYFSVVLLTLALIFFGFGMAMELTYRETDVGVPLFPAYYKHNETYTITAFRIPLLIELPEEDPVLMAFAESRVSALSDSGPKDLAARRSTDGGTTWSNFTFFHSDPKDDNSFDGANLGSVVYDTTTKTLFVFYIVGAHKWDQPDHFVVSSKDAGLTWEPRVNVNYMFEGTDIKLFAPGPTAGIKLTESGRLVVPGWYSRDNPMGAGSCVVYSDDGGLTWILGGLIPKTDDRLPSESTVVELSDGRLLLNMRNDMPQRQLRLQSESFDGGLTWSEATYVEDLLDPQCQGSMLKTSPSSTDFFFSNPRSTKKRENGYLMRSSDEGLTYTKVMSIDKEAFGYSGLATISTDPTESPSNDNTRLGVIWESSEACTPRQYFSGLFFSCTVQGWVRTVHYFSNSIRFRTLELGEGLK